MDLKTIPIGLSKYSVIKYVLHVIDSRSRHVRRYYLRSTANLHQWVKKYRNYLRMRGHALGHLMPDGQFKTEAMEELAAAEPTFELGYSAPNCQSQNGLAEADIKSWERKVSAILDWQMRDPKSQVTYAHFHLASECLTQIENMMFNPACPEVTADEAVNGVQPDVSLWQVPLCRVWYYIYPELRKNLIF
jgi:hypothetical protein